MEHPDWETPEDSARYSAVKLFMLAARRVRPDFELHDGDLAYLTRICRLVGGMPLGILLAAGWVDTLTPAEIAAEIVQNLDFLETETRDVPERQRSIRAVLDHSWRLLLDQERDVLQGMSVFRGSFTREAAKAVTDASLRDLRALVNKSLLHHAREGRYEIHELLRQYAEEELDQVPSAAEVAHDRHCAYYCAALERWCAELKGPRQLTAITEMRADSENARAAWDWAVERGQVARLDQALEGLCLFYEMRGRYQEGESACSIAVDRLAATTSGDALAASISPADGFRVLVRILTWHAWFSWFLGRTEAASQLVRQASILLERPELVGQDTRAEKAHNLRLLGIAALDTHGEETLRLAEQSLALYEAVGDRWQTAWALDQVALMHWILGGYDKAQPLAEESLALRRNLGDRLNMWLPFRTLINVAASRGQLKEAERLAQESLAICEETGVGVEIAKSGLGHALLSNGRFAESDKLMEEDAAYDHDVGAHRSYVLSSSSLCYPKLHLGRYEEARAQAQMSVSVAREMDLRLAIAQCLEVLGCVALVKEANAEAQGFLQESVALFGELGRREYLGRALAWLGYAAQGLGDLRQAARHLHEALRIAIEIRGFGPLIRALPGIALLLADEGQTERAVELYALAFRYPYVANSRWFEDVIGKHIAALAATLPPDVVAAAQERGRARDLWETAEERLEELGE